MFILLNSAHRSLEAMSPTATEKIVGTASTSLILRTTMAKLRFVDLI